LGVKFVIRDEFAPKDSAACIKRVALPRLIPNSASIHGKKLPWSIKTDFLPAQSY
jgi:hypothetical protein